MYSVLRVAFAYRGRAVLTAGLLTFVFIFLLSLVPPKPEATYGIWNLFVFLFGFMVSLYLWTVDLSERRNLLWVQLPLPQRQLATARLLMPLLVQVAASIAAFVGMLGMQLIKSQVDLMEVGFRVLSGQSLGLIFIYLIFFNEEISIALSRQRWLVIAINIALLPVFFFLSFRTSLLDLHETWRGIAAFHLTAFFMAGLAWFMFIRRHSFLVGVNMWTGLPEDWTEE